MNPPPHAPRSVTLRLHLPTTPIKSCSGLWGFVGLSGVAYAVIVVRRMRVQTSYQPDFEDWSFHALLPLVAYAMLALSAFAASSYTREALFGAGTAALLLLFIGIHNAWDAVAYHVLVSNRNTKD